MLSSNPILEDNDFVNLGEFNYHQFKILAIRKLDKVAQVARVQFEWLSRQAVMLPYGIISNFMLKMILH